MLCLVADVSLAMACGDHGHIDDMIYRGEKHLPLSRVASGSVEADSPLNMISGGAKPYPTLELVAGCTGPVPTPGRMQSSNMASGIDGPVSTPDVRFNVALGHGVKTETAHVSKSRLAAHAIEIVTLLANTYMKEVEEHGLVKDDVTAIWEELGSVRRLHNKTVDDIEKEHAAQISYLKRKIGEKDEEIFELKRLRPRPPTTSPPRYLRYGSRD